MKELDNYDIKEVFHKALERRAYFFRKFADELEEFMIHPQDLVCLSDDFLIIKEKSIKIHQYLTKHMDQLRSMKITMSQYDHLNIHLVSNFILLEFWNFRQNIVTETPFHHIPQDFSLWTLHRALYISSTRISLNVFKLRHFSSFQENSTTSK
jgi:hypothetical protein